MNGAERIAAERQRQIEAEGWTLEHDDTHHHHVLVLAARGYAFAVGADSVPTDWPWEDEDWKPSPDPIRNLEKAGALIAAEIDRLLRLTGQADR